MGVFSACGGGGDGGDRYTISGRAALNSVGYEGVTITLSGDAAQATSTDNEGFYSFTDLPAGDYVLTPALVANGVGQNLHPASLEISLSGSDSTDNNFDVDTHSISGRITDPDGAAVPGAIMGLTGDATDSMITDEPGTYSFSGLMNGSYTVTPALEGEWPVPARVDLDLSGSDVPDIDFVAGAHLVTGNVTLNGKGYSGVTMALSGDDSAVTTTDSSGRFQFLVFDGTYAVTPTLAGQTLTPASSTEIVVSGNDSTANDFILDTYALSGRVTLNSSGYTGVAVKLSGDASDAADTDASGDYSFQVLNGTYTVTPDLPGQALDPASVSGITVDYAPNTGNNFCIVTYPITGIVTLLGDPYEGAAVHLTGTLSDSTSTDSSGSYSFDVINGTYTVTPVVPGQSLSPIDIISIVVASAGSGGNDFVLDTHSLSGQVTLAGLGLADVSLEITGAEAGNTTTDGSGLYTFTGLLNGSYSVLPSIMINGHPQVFSPSTLTDTISYTDSTGNDFSVRTFMISGEVTHNLDGYEGALITLAGDASNSGATDSSGNYAFPGLLNGDYTITPSVADQTLSPDLRTLTVDGADITTADFSLDTYSIGGKVTFDGSGYAGASLILVGDASESEVTDWKGDYTFSGLLNGNYTVTPHVTSQTLHPATAARNVSYQNITGVNFALDTYTISGMVSNNTGPMPGIDVDLTGDLALTTATDAYGTFSFSVLNGTYNIAPIAVPQAFDPVSSLVAVSGSYVENVDFHAPWMVWLVDLDAAGIQDGYTWPNAFTHPQDAMDIAFPGDQVWVSKGTYNARHPEETFLLSLIDGVAVYGGFSGMESDLLQRDWTRNETILDADGWLPEEGYRQVIVANADETLVDGFTITGGVDNYASFFSGMGINASTTETIHSFFSNCSIIENFGGDAAPGMYIDASLESVLTFTGCEFLENQGGWSVASIWIASGNVTFTGCDISGNSVSEGTGGIVIDPEGKVTLERSFVENNACTGQSGAGGIENYGDVSIVNSVIAGNSAEVANGMGGGIKAGGTTSIVNSTIVNNQAGMLSGGGGIYAGGSAVDIVNSILWGNAKSDEESGFSFDSQIEGEPRSVTYSDVMGGWAGTMNIDGDPAFASSTDFYLTEGSPCIDAGTAEGAPPEDIEGNPRPAGAGYDMGAFEYTP